MFIHVCTHVLAMCLQPMKVVGCLSVSVVSKFLSLCTVIVRCLSGKQQVGCKLFGMCGIREHSAHWLGNILFGLFPACLHFCYIYL